MDFFFFFLPVSIRVFFYDQMDDSAMDTSLKVVEIL